MKVLQQVLDGRKKSDSDHVKGSPCGLEQESAQPTASLVGGEPVTEEDSTNQAPMIVTSTNGGIVEAATSNSSGSLIRSFPVPHQPTPLMPSNSHMLGHVLPHINNTMAPLSYNSGHHFHPHQTTAPMTSAYVPVTHCSTTPAYTFSVPTQAHGTSSSQMMEYRPERAMSNSKRKHRSQHDLSDQYGSSSDLSMSSEEESTTNHSRRGKGKSRKRSRKGNKHHTRRQSHGTSSHTDSRRRRGGESDDDDDDDDSGDPAAFLEILQGMGKRYRK